MLLQNGAILEIGQMAVFDCLANGGDEMVSGEAWDVRHAVVKRGDVDGP